MRIAFHPSYIHPLPANHRFPMVKYHNLKQFCDTHWANQNNWLITPEPMPCHLLNTTHSEEYLQKLQKGTLSKLEERKLGFPWSKELWERELRIVQGTWELIRYVFENQSFGINLAGGTHHAFRDRGEGFCLLNDLAIGANLGIQGIDLDVHQGNGTAKLMENTPQCFTFSMHAQKTYPLQKEKSDLDLAFAPNTTDEHYLTELELHLTILLSEIKPEIILFNAGVDILEGDEVGTLKISLEGCRKRDEMVFSHAAQHGIPVVTTMGGGYQKNIDIITQAHIQTILEAQKWEPFLKSNH